MTNNDADRLAAAIIDAEYRKDREAYLDLWEEVANNNNSINRLYDAVESRVKAHHNRAGR